MPNRPVPTGKKPAARSRKARGQGHERRAEILQAAKQMFIADGYENVTTRGLAQRVGVSQTGLYVYFKTKEEILHAIAQATFEGLAERLREVAAQPLSIAMLRQLGDAYVRFGLQHPDEYQLSFMVREPMQHQKSFDVSPAQQHAGMRAFLVMHEQFARAIEAKLLRPLHPMAAAQIAWFSVHGLVAALIARPNFPWLDRETLIDTTLDTLMRGLAPENADAKRTRR